jgi:hypothetical protein
MPLGTVKRIFSIQVCAAWIKENGDEEREFESQIVCLSPTGDNIFHTGTVSVRFTGPLQRIMSAPSSSVNFPSPGIFTLKSQIRPVGSSEWVDQVFRFVVTDITPTPAASC